MNWKQKGLGLIALGAILLFVFVGGLFLYVGATATPLHPNPQNVPSVMRVAPPHKWSSAVEQARQVVRAGAAGQNLPGVSVAVGVSEVIVWTEGFGRAHPPRT